MTAVYIALMFLAPVLGGIVIGAIQLAAYRALRRPSDAVPSFAILFARGLLIFFVLSAVLAVTLRFLP